MNTTNFSDTTWFHGTKNNLTSLQENYIIHSDYCNSGLGLFLTKSIDLAKSYADNGYIIKLDVDTSMCYLCNHEEFWAMNEPFHAEEDLDPMGNYINLPGHKFKNKLLKDGYTTLLYDDEMGQVLVVLDNKVATIIGSIKLKTKKNIKSK